MATEQQTSPQQLANGLGWFSIGLGLAEVAAPRMVADLIGVQQDEKTRKTLQVYGARELAAGVGILSQSNPSGWLWARVAGDLLDLSSLCKAMVSDGNDRGRVLVATAAVIGTTVADVRCAMRLSSAKENGQASTKEAAMKSSIIIARSPDEVYGFWRNFGRLPEIFDRLESVQVLGHQRSHWKLVLPMGRSLEWDAEITDEQPDSRIAWRSLSSSAPHSGVVRFEPATGGRGTRVSLEIRPEGVSTTLGKLFGIVPEQHLKIALHNLKQLLETGEVVKSDASIHRGMYPAQPPAEYPGAGQGLRAAASV